MAYKHVLKTAQDYTNFGLSPVGPYNGRDTYGTGSGTGNEPAYFIRSYEDGSNSTNTCWKSGVRNSSLSNELLIGDGSSTNFREIGVLMKLRIDDPVNNGLGYSRWVWMIGNNGGLDSAGTVSMNVFEGGGIGFHWTWRFLGDFTKFRFSPSHPLSVLLYDNQWHNCEFRFKQRTLGVFDRALGPYPNSDLNVIIDDVSYTPDEISSGNGIDDWDSSKDHFFYPWRYYK